MWRDLEPCNFSLAIPDLEAFRTPGSPKNVLEVELPTNFRAATFTAPGDTSLLREIDRDIEEVACDDGGTPLTLPVKLKVHDSLFVLLAKRTRFITGNDRCLEAEGPMPLAQAVHANPERPHAIYERVVALPLDMGAGIPGIGCPGLEEHVNAKLPGLRCGHVDAGDG